MDERPRPRVPRRKVAVLAVRAARDRQRACRRCRIRSVPSSRRARRHARLGLRSLIMRQISVGANTQSTMTSILSNIALAFLS